MSQCPFKFSDINPYCLGRGCALCVDGKCAIVVIAENSKGKKDDENKQNIPKTY